MATGNSTNFLKEIGKQIFCEFFKISYLHAKNTDEFLNQKTQYTDLFPKMLKISIRSINESTYLIVGAVIFSVVDIFIIIILDCIIYVCADLLPLYLWKQHFFKEVKTRWATSWENLSYAICEQQRRICAVWSAPLLFAASLVSILAISCL